MLKGLKQALGVGKAEDFYARALEELAQQNPGAAIESFGTAARKAASEGRDDLRARAEASALLYQFIVNGNLDSLAAMARHLERADWIERPGEPSDRVPATALIAEIEGRLSAAHARGMGAEAAQEANRRAAEAFARCGEHRLVTYPHHHRGDSHVDLARNRHLYHSAWMHTLTAEQLIESDPEAAAKAMGRAVAAFAGCDDADRQHVCAESLRRMQTRRTCWLCQREYPGEGRYYGRAGADVTPFIARHLAAQGQDASCVDADAGEVVLCTVCRTVIEGRARHLVEEMGANLMKNVDARVMEIVQSMPKR